MNGKIIAILLAFTMAACTNTKKKIWISHTRVENMQDLSDTIEFGASTKVNIYCTGELSPDWASSSSRYLGQGDDIELFVRTVDNELKRVVFKESDKKGDTLTSKIDSFSCNQYYDRIERKFIAVIKIPVSSVVDKTNKSRLLEFDIAAGDNDNGISQKAKLCWANQKDPLFENDIKGKLLLSDTDLLSSDPRVAVAKKNRSSKVDWSNYTHYKLVNIVNGQINDMADFSAFYQVCWDDQAILVRIEVNDSKEGKFKSENLLREDIFVDKGWIEDIRGRKIWQMNLLQSKHAGGAFKNRYCDTVLQLKPGKYIVKYSSDESHSWKSWDSPIPNADFWGIRISEK